MLNIAIVEDSPGEAECLRQCIERFAHENHEETQCFVFDRAISYLESHQSQYDIVFMDIELPDMNGMEAARWLRKKDSTVTLVFVTHLAQYAVNGYEVDALDYIIKPVVYPAFALKMKRAVANRRMDQRTEIILKTSSGMVRLQSDKVKYVEIYQHRILYHTESETLEAYGTLKQVESTLLETGFFRCSSSFIVNLRHVERIEGANMIVGGMQLPISRQRKKEFMSALHNYYLGRDIC